MPFTISSITTSRSASDLKLQADWEAIAGRIAVLARELPDDKESESQEQTEWMRRWSALMDEAKAALSLAKERGLGLEFIGDVSQAEKQFDVWTTRFRLKAVADAALREAQAKGTDRFDIVRPLENKVLLHMVADMLSAGLWNIRKNGYCIYGYKYLIVIHNGPL
ncbi:hypothetical protein M405DRAFT_869358 [Rhizopogon salebrosus TDB-379]|nr:hypothetical protein M405DRAFT_869358 [Rhizopogon salebrosus TDB-379]